ncbi:MAG: hypothetical protein HC929_03435 [Leptolyngbyaceae cyanobacterium SM2_5_2]|nr:hypothetical protein [Leptolyngbyaceae cyanobacterium SM2_5_2]
MGWSEEVLFRGWLLRELEQGWPPSGLHLGLAVSSLPLHTLSSPWRLSSERYLSFGATLVGADAGLGQADTVAPAPRETSLGPAVGLHSGLVWGYYVVSVGDLVYATERVPAWVTGLDGNPLAGLLGIGLLGGLARLFFRWAQTPGTNPPYQ